MEFTGSSGRSGRNHMVFKNQLPDLPELPVIRDLIFPKQAP